MVRDNHKIYSTLTSLGVLGLNTFGAEAGLTVGPCWAQPSWKEVKVY